MPQVIDRADTIVMLIQQQFMGRFKGMTLYFYNTVPVQPGSVASERYYTAAISNLTNVHLRATEDEKPGIFIEVAMQIPEPRSRAMLPRESSWESVNLQHQPKVVYSQFQFMVPTATEIASYEYGFEVRSQTTGLEAIKNEYFNMYQRPGHVYGVTEIVRPPIREGVTFEPVKVWRLVDDGFDEFIKRTQIRAKRRAEDKHLQVGQHRRQLILTSEEE